MRLLTLLLFFLAAATVSAKPLLVIIDAAVYSRLTNYPAYVTERTAKGWTVETVLYESRTNLKTNAVVTVTAGIRRTNYVISSFGVNVSSRAATALATNIIWPRVKAGVHDVFLIGELPQPVSGLNNCPDGHGSTFTWDGWRDAQNTAGAYRATQFYGTPAPITRFAGGWTDDFTAPMSVQVLRNNIPGDGRYDNTYLPARPLAAVGIFGAFGDVSGDQFGLDRRADIINKYLRRIVEYRTGSWRASGAVYEFALGQPDVHTDELWLARAKELYGTNVVVDAFHTLKGDGLTNRVTAFKMAYIGSSWYDSWFRKAAHPFAALFFQELSYSKEIPDNNTLTRLVLDNVFNGPLVVIPWETGQLLDIRVMGNGGTVGEMFLEASNRIFDAAAARNGTAYLPITVGFYGDPTLDLIP